MNQDIDAIMAQFLKEHPSLEAEYSRFMEGYHSLLASLNHSLYIKEIDAAMPIRLINIMVERMNAITRHKISKYGVYRDCEDYITKTEWFFALPDRTQYKIRFDFYTTIILGIHAAFYRE